MSPKRRTLFQRMKKDHPNLENTKKAEKRIQRNAEILRQLEEADPKSKKSE